MYPIDASLNLLLEHCFVVLTTSLQSISSMSGDNSRQEGAEAMEDEGETCQPEESGLLQQPQPGSVVNGENQGRSDEQVGHTRTKRFQGSGA